jgi:Leucine rich repeat variant
MEPLPAIEPTLPESFSHWEAELDAILNRTDLGQNDRLAVELLKLGPVPMALVSPWVPSDLLLDNLKIPSLPLKYRLQVLARLAQNPSLQPRLEVAADAETPLAILQQFIGALEPELRQATQQNPNCPPRLIELVEDQLTIASDWDTKAAQLIQLGQSVWPRIRLAVAQNPSTPAATLQDLANDEYFAIQQAIAQNPSTPAAIVTQFTDHPNVKIQTVIASRPDLPEALQLKLLDSCPRAICARQDLHPNVMEVIWKKDIEDKAMPLWKNPQRGFFVSQPMTPESILVKIVQTYDWEAIQTFWHQQALDRQPPTPQYAEGWANDCIELLASVAQHPNVSEALLETIAAYPSPLPKNQFAVFQNPKTPETIRIQLFEKLQAQPNEDWIYSIAQAEITSSEMLEQLAQKYIKASPELTFLQSFLGETGASEALVTAIQQFIEQRESPQQILFWFQQDPVFGAPILQDWLTLLGQLSRQDYLVLHNLCVAGLLDIQRSGVFPERDRWADASPEHMTLYGMLNVFNTNTFKLRAQNQACRSVIPLALINHPKTPEASRKALQVQFEIAPELSGTRYDWDLQLAIATNPAISDAERASACEAILATSSHPSPYWKVQEKLAKNPNTPSEYLRRLMDSPGSIPDYLASNPNTPQSCLALLIQNDSSSSQRKVLGNSHATVDMIIRAQLKIEPEELSSILKQNSGLSDLDRYQILLAVEAQHQEQVVQARVSQTLSQQRNHQAKVVAAQNWNASSYSLEQLSQDENIAIREAVAANRNLSTTGQERMAQDAEGSVRMALARRNRAPIAPEAAVILCQSADRAIHLALAQNEQTPSVILEQLGQLQDPEILNALLTNPQTPAAILQREIPKIQDEKQLELVLRGNRNQQRNLNMPGELLAPFAQSSSDTMRFLVARYRSALPETLELLAADKYDLVRQTVAENPSTSPPVLTAMAQQDHLNSNSGSAHSVSGKIVERKDAPAEALDFVAKQPVQWMRIRVANHPNTSTETLTWLAGNESHEQVLQAVAKHPRASEAVLERLGSHENENVRATIASHPNCPEHLLLLEFFTQKPSTLVMLKVAANPNTPLSYLELFVSSQQSGLRAAVATNPNLPIAHLVTLAADPKVEVRRAVALNPATPEQWRQSLRSLIPAPPLSVPSPTLNGLQRSYDPEMDDLTELLTDYANSENAFVRFATFLNPQAPETVLAQGAVSPSWLERYATAENSNLIIIG